MPLSGRLIYCFDNSSIENNKLLILSRMLKNASKPPLYLSDKEHTKSERRLWKII